MRDTGPSAFQCLFRGIPVAVQRWIYIACLEGYWYNVNRVYVTIPVTRYHTAKNNEITKKEQKAKKNVAFLCFLLFNYYFLVIMGEKLINN